MAAIVRSDHDLPTLRILMGSSERGRGDIVFEAVRGRGLPREVARVSLEEVGVGSRGRRQRTGDDLSPWVPDRVLAALHEAVAGLGPSPMQPEDALWLEFPSPRGILYAMPWERVLAPLGRVMFRLPNHLVRPQAPATTLEVALCASAPLAKSMFDPPLMLELLARQYVEHTGHEVRLHLFTDEAWVGGLRQVADAVPGAGEVVVHDPHQAARYPLPSRTTRLGRSSAVTNPWLCWIRDDLEGHRLDIVHFAGHGYMSGEFGALALASAPTVNTDVELSRFVGAAELTAFLTQVGAWGLGLSGAPGNYSEAGLRELTDAVALVMPGVALTHSFGQDQDARELGMALSAVFRPGESQVAPMPSTTCWVHPAFVEFPPDDQELLHLNADGSSAFVTDSTRDVLAQSDSQAWVAAASRNLEMLQARWLPTTSDEAADPAAVTALQNLSGFLHDFVTTTSSPGGPDRSSGQAYPPQRGS